MIPWSDETAVRDSVACGTTDREACPKRWVAALVQMCTEKKVGERLGKQGIENYVPTQLEIHQWSDRKKKVDRVVIPMVVFIRVDETEEKKVKTLSYIYKLISYPGQKTPATIPDIQVERLKFMLKHADSQVQLNERVFSVGETVCIARGPLKGLEGEVCKAPEDKTMVAIRIECLGYACVNVAKGDIERV